MNLGTSPTDSSKWQVKYEYGELDASGNTNIAKNTGNISKQTINFAGLAQTFVQTYKYDSLNRITEAKENNGTPSGTQNWKQTYNYDRFGNRVAFSQVVNGQQLSVNNQILPAIDSNKNRFAENQGFIYDKTGNITQEIDKSTNLPRTMVFNGDNKQVTVKNSSGTPIGTYYYDGEGNRVKKTTLSETTVFVYDASKRLVAEYSTATPPTNPTVSYTATDTLGSPRVITDKNGNVTSRRDFMPFGEEIGLNTAQTIGRNSNPQYNATDNIRQKFTGYEKDKETDLDYAQARYYNNQHGRFTAVDPLLASGKSSNPQTFNRYVYTMNEPMNHTDSTGLQTGTPIDNFNGQVWIKGNTIYDHKIVGSTELGRNTRATDSNGWQYNARVGANGGWSLIKSQRKLAAKQRQQELEKPVRVEKEIRDGNPVGFKANDEIASDSTLDGGSGSGVSGTGVPPMSGEIAEPFAPEPMVPEAMTVEEIIPDAVNLETETLPEECLDIAKAAYDRSGGGEILKITPDGGAVFIEKPAGLYPNTPPWVDHYVHINQRSMVYDPLSSFGTQRVPVQQWNELWKDLFNNTEFYEYK